MTHPPAGPSTPPPPPGPKTTTWREREQAAARWNAAEELQRATDGLRETTRYGMSSEVEAARLRAAQQAWDLVRGAS